jgi:hypothetical protein
MKKGRRRKKSGLELETLLNFQKSLSISARRLFNRCDKNSFLIFYFKVLIRVVPPQVVLMLEGHVAHEAAERPLFRMDLLFVNFQQLLVGKCEVAVVAVCTRSRFRMGLMVVVECLLLSKILAANLTPDEKIKQLLSAPSICECTYLNGFSLVCVLM